MTDWVSYHLHYHSVQYVPLLHGVKPLVAALRAAGAVDRFFFLRYWNGGPHLRLRFRTTGTERVAAVRSETEEQLLRAIALRPSSSPIDARTYERMVAQLGRAEGVGPEPLVDDNRLVARAYEPEFGKYGCGEGVGFAEDVFDASSTMVLNGLAERPEKRAAIAAALLAMLTGLAAVGYDLEAARDFFERYGRFWQGHAPAPPGAVGEATHAQPRSAVTRVARSLLGTTDYPEGLGEWWSLFRSSRARLGLRRDSGADETRLTFLMTNYFHTHNNRLGLLTADEAYLGRLAAASLAPEAVAA